MCASRLEDAARDYLHATKHEWPDKLSLHLKCALSKRHTETGTESDESETVRTRTRIKTSNDMLSVPCNYTNVCVVHFGVATRSPKLFQINYFYEEEVGTERKKREAEE